MPRTAAIRQIAHFIPSRSVTNEDLAREFGDWDVAKIYEKTGINARPVAATDECASDLGVAAAEALFVSGKIPRESVDYLIFCTQSPDYFLPTTACVMQHRLGLPTSCGAIDVNQGCSGFVYGLSLAKGLIEARVAENVLLITADTYSKYIHPGDRSVRTIFGDGAAATWIGAIEADEEWIGPFLLGTDGRGADNLIVRAGGARVPRTPETVKVITDEAGNLRSQEHLYMNGPEIFTFTLKRIPGAVRDLISRAGLGLEDIDYFVFHQANQFMLEQLRKKIGIPNERFCVNLDGFGNTVSSTIPISLQRSVEGGGIKAGARVLLMGFGVGYSWAAAMTRISFA